MFDDAARALEAAHAEDPRRLASGVSWSVHYHRRLAHWIEHLDPKASTALRLAARAAHIRRWTVPRESYEAGRAGYKKWRTDLQQFHAEEAGRILAGAGFDAETIERVQAILQKKHLADDPEVQTFEDGLCLVFLEEELAEFATKHEEAKVVEIVRKTWGKMSERGHAAALELSRTLPQELSALLERALF